MKLAVVVAAVLIALPLSTPCENLDKEWENFKEKFHKTYSCEVEEKLRKLIFEDNLHQITKHNEEFKEGKVSYEKGINQFTDRLSIEIQLGHGPGLDEHVDDNEWENFTNTFNKKYSCKVEENIRKLIFRENVRAIREQNKKYEEGASSYMAGISEFTDQLSIELPRGFKHKQQVVPRAN